MKHSIEITPNLRSLMAREIEVTEQGVTKGMRRAGIELQRDWRDQIRAANLGRKLAGTIRRRSYPEQGVSMKAAVLVWSKAPDIVSAHDAGATIRSADGFWLSIPLPAAGRGRFGRRLTPGEYEQRTGQRLRLVYRPGKPGLLVADDARITRRGLARRKGGRRRKDGILTGAQTVPVFLLVPQVSLRKKLDLASGAARVANRLPGLILGGMQD